jgi:putative holliday junction resolvase
VLALDIGTAWTGVAISDSLRMLARPVTAVQASALTSYLEQLFMQEQITTVVVGYPRTMRGTESDQTRQVSAVFESLQAQFPGLQWLLWDERLSSKRAAQQGSRRTKETRLHEQARAAAFILDLYLTYLASQGIYHSD